MNKLPMVHCNFLNISLEFDCAFTCLKHPLQPCYELSFTAAFSFRNGVLYITAWAA